jgi:hypothetical protein
VSKLSGGARPVGRHSMIYRASNFSAFDWRNAPLKSSHGSPAALSLLSPCETCRRPLAVRDMSSSSRRVRHVVVGPTHEPDGFICWAMSALA